MIVQKKKPRYTWLIVTRIFVVCPGVIHSVVTGSFFFSSTPTEHLWELGRFDVPVLLRVVLNGTVGAELAHFGDGADALLDPLRTVLVRSVNLGERLDVAWSRRSVSVSHQYTNWYALSKSSVRR